MNRLPVFVMTIFLGIFLFPSPALAETLELTPTADTYVNNGASYLNTNFGSAHSLIVSNDRFSRLSLIQFDLSSLTQEVIIDSAELKLYLYRAADNSPVAVKVGRITQKWQEEEVTFTSSPRAITQEESTTSISNTLGYKFWPVTNLVKEWQNKGFPNYGLGLSSLDTNYSLSFRSQEFGSNPPLLLISYHLPEVSPEVTPEEEPSPTSIPSIISPTPTATNTPPQKNNPLALSGLALLTVLTSTIACAFYFLAGISK